MRFITMVMDGSFIRIGELFTGAEILTEQTLESRLALSRERNVPLGRTLVDAGDITSYQLLSIVQIQSLLHDGLIDLNTALAAIGLIYSESIPFDVALSRLNYCQTNVPTCKLGEMLVESRLISQMDLFAALSACFETCLPLGAILVERQIQSNDAIQLALSLQQQVRNRLISRQAAIERLQLGFLGAKDDNGDYIWLAHKAKYATQNRTPAEIQQKQQSIRPAANPTLPAPAPMQPATQAPAPAAASVSSNTADPQTSSILEPVARLRGLAQQHYKLGRYAEAEKTYAEALKEAERISERASIVSLADMAGFYVKRGEPKLALKLYERAIIIAEKHLTASHSFCSDLRHKRDVLRAKIEQNTPLPELQWLS